MFITGMIFYGRTVRSIVLDFSGDIEDFGKYFGQ
jgi:hypothetical protein